jgi:hypothetical protein
MRTPGFIKRGHGFEVDDSAFRPCCSSVGTGIPRPQVQGGTLPRHGSKPQPAALPRHYDSVVLRERRVDEGELLAAQVVLHERRALARQEVEGVPHERGGTHVHAGVGASVVGRGCVAPGAGLRRVDAGGGHPAEVAHERHEEGPTAAVEVVAAGCVRGAEHRGVPVPEIEVRHGHVPLLPRDGVPDDEGPFLVPGSDDVEKDPAVAGVEREPVEAVAGARAEGGDVDELRDDKALEVGEVVVEEEAQERRRPVKVAIAAEVRRRRQALQTAEQRIRASHLCGVTRRRISWMRSSNSSGGGRRWRGQVTVVLDIGVGPGWVTGLGDSR